MQIHNTIMSRLASNKPVLVAEAGVNYYDIAAKFGITPIEAAKKMVVEAKNAGLHAIKFQSYKAEELAAKVSPYYWDIKENPVKSQLYSCAHF